jgi:hypothetical protein
VLRKDRDKDWSASVRKLIGPINKTQFDLIGPHGDTLLQNRWEQYFEPGSEYLKPNDTITMQLWPEATSVKIRSVLSRILDRS